MSEFFEHDLSDKTEEQVIFDMNESMLKADGAVLFTIHKNGKIEYFTNIKGFPFLERIGLFNYIKEKMFEFVSREMRPPERGGM